MGLEKKNRNTYATIIADGTIRVKVPEGTPDAIKRTYNLKDGTEGSKWELVYDSLSGMINNIQFKDGQYGKNLEVNVDGIILSMGLKAGFAEDLMKRLPAINFNEAVKLAPYNFKNEKGKDMKGVAVKQNDEIVKDFFKDHVAKKNINGFPEIEGDYKNFDSDDWAVHFTKVRKFLQNYLEVNIIPQFGQYSVVTPSGETYSTGSNGEMNMDSMNFNDPEPVQPTPIQQTLVQPVEPVQPTSPIATAPATAPADLIQLTPDEIVEEIKNIVSQKFNLTDLEEIKKKTEEVTGLAFYKGNLQAMLQILKG